MEINLQIVYLYLYESYVTNNTDRIFFINKHLRNFLFISYLYNLLNLDSLSIGQSLTGLSIMFSTFKLFR